MPLWTFKLKQKCSIWARDNQNCSVDQWNRLIFSNESIFCISFGDHEPRIWRMSYERYNAKCMKESVKFPQSVIVWGCMSATWVGKIWFLKRSINTVFDQDVLNHFLIPYIEDKFRDNEFIFQHDFAPPHTTKPTKEWRRKTRIPVLDWPANSPDANLIEN